MNVILYYEKYVLILMVVIGIFTVGEYNVWYGYSTSDLIVAGSFIMTTIPIAFLWIISPALPFKWTAVIITIVMMLTILVLAVQILYLLIVAIRVFVFWY